MISVPHDQGLNAQPSRIRSERPARATAQARTGRWRANRSPPARNQPCCGEADLEAQDPISVLSDRARRGQRGEHPGRAKSPVHSLRFRCDQHFALAPAGLALTGRIMPCNGFRPRRVDTLLRPVNTVSMMSKRVPGRRRASTVGYYCKEPGCTRTASGNGVRVPICPLHGVPMKKRTKPRKR